MTNSIVPSNFADLSKEFKTDDEGKGFVTRRGLARMCGVKHQNWGRSGSKYTIVIDEYLSGRGLTVVANTTSLISDIEASLVVKHYAYAGKIEAQKVDELLGATGLRVLIQQSTGYKPTPKRKLTAEEIIEVCCLPVPTTWERRFPEEYYEHLSRLTGLVVDGHTRPAYWAALTKELVYSYLPSGIYTEIKRCKDESGNWDKLHQYLSVDGIQILETHQRKVLHHMQGAANISQLRIALKQACTGEYQLVLL